MEAIQKVKSIEIRWELVLLGFALAAACALALSGIGSELLRQSAGIPDSAEGFGRIKQMAKAIQTPALFTAGCMIPLVIIGGALALMFGGRQAGTWIARAVGAMFLLAVVGGLAT
ncbi:MAG: hypothetical protein J0H98_07090 [Solirubrobacterales bacterium]|nr:hypothetical protein [Solirubrobacterales bacterium]